MTAAAGALGGGGRRGRRRAVRRGRGRGPRAAVVRHAGDPEPGGAGGVGLSPRGRTRLSLRLRERSPWLRVAPVLRVAPLSPGGLLIVSGGRVRFWHGEDEQARTSSGTGTGRCSTTIDAIIGATNAAFAELGLEPITLEQYRDAVLRAGAEVLRAADGAAAHRCRVGGHGRDLPPVLRRAPGEVRADRGGRGAARRVAVRPGAASRSSACTCTSELVPLVRGFGIEPHFMRVDGRTGPSGGSKAEHMVRHLAALAGVDAGADRGDRGRRRRRGGGAARGGAGRAVHRRVAQPGEPEVAGCRWWTPWRRRSRRRSGSRRDASVRCGAPQATSGTRRQPQAPARTRCRPPPLCRTSKFTPRFCTHTAHDGPPVRSDSLGGVISAIVRGGARRPCPAPGEHGPHPWPGGGSLVLAGGTGHQGPQDAVHTPAPAPQRAASHPGGVSRMADIPPLISPCGIASEQTGDPASRRHVAGEETVLPSTSRNGARQEPEDNADQAGRSQGRAAREGRPGS